MKRAFYTITIILIFALTTNMAFASEFRRNLLIQKYCSINPAGWDEISKANEELVNEELLEEVKNRYYKVVYAVNADAEKNQKARVIPDYIFIYANLADYLGEKLNKECNLRLELAREYSYDGQLDNAVEILSNILVDDPENIEVKEFQASLFLKLDMPNEAFEVYQAILKQDENNKKALYFLGNMYLQLGQYEKAVELFRRLLELEPGNERAQKFVDLYDGKIQTTDNKKVNDNAVKHFMLGEKFYNNEEYEAAAEEYSRAIENDPRFYQAYAYLGESLIKMKKYQDAIEVLDHAINMEPYYPTAYHFKGLALEKEYDFTRKEELLRTAVKNYEKALEVDPKYKKVREDLDRAKKRLGEPAEKS
ncbi:MAG: tetratricopeptide repeat protein [Vulcanimicrobiota bacterium]